MQVDLDVDVAVVGFGPSGAVASGLLGGMGLRTYTCDRSRDVYDKPRAIAIDHEALRVIQQIGVVDRVLDHAEPFTPSEYHGVDGRLIKRFHTADPPYPLGFVPSMVFDQPSVERILRDHVAALPAVHVALGTVLVGLDQDQDGVTLRLERDGMASTVRARYVIGCDGAASTVRKLLGISLEDLGFDEPWLVVDMLVNDSGLAKLPIVSKQYCEPSRPCSYIIGPGNHRRWELAIDADQDPAQVATEEGTWALLSRWLDPDDATLWRCAAYRFHALVAAEWRQGRVFLAGDAAHQQPPFLGQGMCQGIRDVANLAWKLQSVVSGGAHESLLDTYGVERKAHVTDLTSRIKDIGRLVGERNPERARARDAALLEATAGTVVSVPRQDVQPPLTAGLTVSGSHPAVGTVAPQPWIVTDAGIARLDDVVGTGWRLLLGSNAGTAFDRVASVAESLGIRPVRIGPTALQEVEDLVAEWFLSHRCVAAIVRPDHYVYAVGDSATSVLSSLTELGRTLRPGREV